MEKGESSIALWKVGKHGLATHHVPWDGSFKFTEVSGSTYSVGETVPTELSLELVPHNAIAHALNEVFDSYEY